MTECVVLWRNTQNGKVGFVSEDDPDKIAVFANWDAAYDAVHDTTVCRAFPWQIVELDEL